MMGDIQPVPFIPAIEQEAAKLEWACRQIEALLRRVAELEGQTRELNPGLAPWEEQNPCAD